VEDFFGDYGTGGGLAGNMGSGYTVVPEPITCLLFGGSILGGLCLRRRRAL
jgi:hypothetical protein